MLRSDSLAPAAAEPDLTATASVLARLAEEWWAARRATADGDQPELAQGEAALPGTGVAPSEG